MAKKCIVCGKETIFFSWGNGRNINKDVIRQFISEKDVEKVVVCFKCGEEHKIFIKRPKIDPNLPIRYVTWQEYHKRADIFEQPQL